MRSVHPFTSGFEYMFFFSAYKKRAAESAEFYKKYFHAAAYLGAEYVVFHGDSLNAPFFGIESYCETLSLLIETARREGTVLAHENVSTARAGNPDFIRQLRAHFGNGNLSFVFDVKQATRAGYSPFDMISAMGKDIKHVHINDWMDGDCRLPYAGSLDIDAIISQVEANDYTGQYIIEVYRRNFNDFEDIIISKDRLLKIQ